MSQGQRGFTLMEMALVLVVIGLILGAVSLGRGVQRNAVYQNITSDFVQGWVIAYDSYYTGNNHPPGDDPSNPSAKVNNAKDSELCGTDLKDTFLAAGIQLPQGRAEGAENLFVYQDVNGNPHQLEVCFVNADWHEPGNSSGDYVLRERNQLILKGVVPSLARYVD
ncbi:MAG: type II secretion system protein, partial [Marinobacterium sp.]